MKAKTYIFTSVFLMIIFVLYHFIVWNFFTKQFLVLNDQTIIGDLGRMSYSLNSLTKRKGSISLTKRHIDFSLDSKGAEIITIGDSFSNGGAGGLNPYYQDYIATNYNKTVMNIQPLSQGYIETVLILSNNGMLDELGVKVIILESVEREVLRKYSKTINWNIYKDKEYIYKNLSTKNYGSNMPRLFFINNLNYNSLLYNLLYKYSDNAIFSKVYKTLLSKELFTTINSDTLLFLNDDLSNLSSYDISNIALINNNLNRLQKELKKKNIKLYFMPVVDKYNLYSKYIINNKYKENIFFELVRTLQKDYILIDTKSILRELTDKGIKDVFYSDETHWGFKASEEIFKQVKFQ